MTHKENNEQGIMCPGENFTHQLPGSKQIQKETRWLLIVHRIIIFNKKKIGCVSNILENIVIGTLQTQYSILNRHFVNIQHS